MQSRKQALYLCEGWQELILALFTGRVHQSYGSWQSAGVAGGDVPVGGVDGRLPLHQGGGGQVAEGA